MLKNPVIIGKIGKPFGIKGFFKLISYTSPPGNIFQYPEWFIALEQANNWVKYQVESHQAHHDHWIAKLVGIDTPEAIKSLLHAEIAIAREVLPEPPANQYYFYDLIGCEVFNSDDSFLGKVEDILTIAEQDMLSIQGEKKYLIPFKLNIFIKKVNISEKRIDADWDKDFHA